MKNLITILSCIFVLSACSSPTSEATQDYTSFVFMQTIDNKLPDCVAAYLDEDLNYIKIADLGTLERAGQLTEEIIIDESIANIHLFITYSGFRRLDSVFSVKPNKKNIFRIEKDVRGIVVNKEDPKQYPQ